ncbi:CHC2 zinc finger domain-containing protein [Rhizorhabdus histidinilytica]|uniref:DNA primase n=1 Tax=Rhizorhabdus histidinilytica TaxID=439228 RepID=A0A1T5CHF8_9SPHN|nr:CHC2 zinc finger domain-containing protein [Rhizorhabdus histidinilytica]SKB58908.1 DNA primase [Rhizorhabdus histidinilytica]
MMWKHPRNAQPRDPAEEAQFRQRVEDARSLHNISDVVGRYTKLRKAGRELQGLCVFHDERSPSLRVNDAKGTYHSFGCGASGDIIRFVMAKEGLGFTDTLAWLGVSDLPIVSAEQRAQRAAEDAAEREQAIAEARTFWDAAVPTAGTPASVYARSRGINMELPPSIRFGMVPAARDKETGKWGRALPALLGAVTIGDDLVAIQRIFLLDDGADKRWQKPRRSKLSLGRVAGGAIWLGPPAAEVVITEGPEDALSLAQEMPGQTVLAALGTALMPMIRFPEVVKSVLIAGQNDAAGRSAVERAAQELTDVGLAVRVMWPSNGYKDWNDQLRGIRQ